MGCSKKYMMYWGIYVLYYIPLFQISVHKFLCIFITILCTVNNFSAKNKKIMEKLLDFSMIFSYFYNIVFL